MRKIFFASVLLVIVVSCSPPSIENPYRKEAVFPGGLDVPVALLTIEAGGEVKTMASGWLIDGGNDALFTAKHFTDDFIGNFIELGGNECKVFLNGHVYGCAIDRVPPLRDAVVLRLIGSFRKDQLPKAYMIATKSLKIGEKVIVQGFHPHPREIVESNAEEGLNDRFIPILRTYYQVRMADPLRQREVVFDSLEAKVVGLSEHVLIGGTGNDPLARFRYAINDYIKIVTARNHKFSFAGLSGGVALRANETGELEAVGIVTAEAPVRFEYDKKGRVKDESIKIGIADTLSITPIDSVRDLYLYTKDRK